MLAMGFLIALAIWPSWQRYWAFLAIMTAVSVFAVAGFYLMANGMSDDQQIQAHMNDYLFVGQGLVRKSVNLVVYAAIGALIVWGRLTMRAEAEWKKGAPERAAARAAAKAIALQAKPPIVTQSIAAPVTPPVARLKALSTQTRDMFVILTLSGVIFLIIGFILEGSGDTLIDWIISYDTWMSALLWVCIGILVGAASLYVLRRTNLLSTGTVPLTGAPVDTDQSQPR